MITNKIAVDDTEKQIHDRVVAKQVLLDLFPSSHCRVLFDEENKYFIRFHRDYSDRIIVEDGLGHNYVLFTEVLPTIMLDYLDEERESEIKNHLECAIDNLISNPKENVLFNLKDILNKGISGRIPSQNEVRLENTKLKLSNIGQKRIDVIENFINYYDDEFSASWDIVPPNAGEYDLWIFGDWTASVQPIRDNGLT